MPGAAAALGSGVVSGQRAAESPAVALGGSTARVDVETRKEDGKAAQLDVLRAQMPDQMPRQITALKRNDLEDIPAREIEQFDLAGIWGEPTENQIPADDLWAELWRAEKDGRGKYRYVLRFVKCRIIKPGGKLTPAIEARLAHRRGKGRHQKSRDEADRLRGFAEYLAAGYQSDQTRRSSDQAAGDTARSSDPAAQHTGVPTMRSVDNGELPDVRGSFIN